MNTQGGSQLVARRAQNALVAGRKPLAVVAQASDQRRSYAMAIENTDKGVVCRGLLDMSQPRTDDDLGPERFLSAGQYRKLH